MAARQPMSTVDRERITISHRRETWDQKGRLQHTDHGRCGDVVSCAPQSKKKAASKGGFLVQNDDRRSCRWRAYAMAAFASAVRGRAASRPTINRAARADDGSSTAATSVGAVPTIVKIRQPRRNSRILAADDRAQNGRQPRSSVNSAKLVPLGRCPMRVKRQ